MLDPIEPDIAINVFMIPMRSVSGEESFDKLIEQLESVDKNLANQRAEFNAAVALMRDRIERK